MTREEIQKLLGGYATDTLTPEEQQALFAAALEDQELFDALGREQSLRDLLADPAARAHLLTALDAPAPKPWFHRWWKPLSAVAAVAVLASAAIVVVRRNQVIQPPTLVARVEQPVAPPVVVVPPAAPVAAEASHASAKASLATIKQAPLGAAQPIAPVPMKAPPSPPPPAPATPAVADAKKDAALRDKLQFAVPATTEAVQVQPNAFLGTPTSPPLVQAKELQNLPATTRGAATNGVIAVLKPSAAPPDARALFYGAGMAGGVVGGGGGSGGRGGAAGLAAGFRAVAAPAGTTHLGIQYRILRKSDSGEFVEADAAATGLVATGTNFKLRITANGHGYVRVLQEMPDGTWRAILNRAVEGLQPIDTEPIALDQPGRVKFYLTFAREPLPDSAIAQPDDDIVADRGPVVTVAGRIAGTPQLCFNIMLTVQ